MGGNEMTSCWSGVGVRRVEEGGECRRFGCLEGGAVGEVLAALVGDGRRGLDDGMGFSHEVGEDVAGLEDVHAVA